MAAKITITNPGTETFDAPREHQGYRLDARTLAIIEDLAMGIEAGESGLKSCAIGASAAGEAGAKGAEVSARHHVEAVQIEDEDECFDAIGDLLAAGFSHAEIAKRVGLSGGATHMLALERWADKVRLTCDLDAPRESELHGRPWRGSALHERRRQGHRAMAALRRTVEGTAHAAVLHIVYGWADPFVGTLPADVRVALGREFAPLARYTDVVEAKRVECAQRHARDLSVDSNGAVDLSGYRVRVGREDRCLSSGDGLRYAVAPFTEPMPVHQDGENPAHWEARKEERKGRRLEHEARIDAFLCDVRREANRMLTDASEAFRDAWQQS